MLQFNNISLTFRSPDRQDVPALQNLHFQVAKNEFVVLCGPSGCGKTSILRLIAGLRFPDTGKLTVKGEEIRKPSPERGIVFQSYNSFPWLSVWANIEFGIKLLIPDPKERHRIVAKQIEVMGLEGFENAYPATLSGGMRQRVALARTLAMSPLILLLDEPFGALDPMNRFLLQNHLQKKWRENRWTVVFVTHDVDEAIFLADRVLILSHRPATIIADEPIPFPRPRSFKIRETEKYKEIRSAILRKIDVSLDEHDQEFHENAAPVDRNISRKRFSWSGFLRDSS